MTASSTSLTLDSTFCWSASFYPQPWLNWQRKSVTGCAIDFPTLNVLGFFSYALSTTALLYSPLIRDQYAQRHPVSPQPTVRLNDVAFAVHAVILSCFTYSQFWPTIWGFKVGRLQRVSRLVLGIFWGCIAAAAASVLLVLFKGADGGRDPFQWAWIDVVSPPEPNPQTQSTLESARNLPESTRSTPSAS